MLPRYRPLQYAADLNFSHLPGNRRVAEPVKEGIGGALAAARQAGPDSATIIDAARNAFTDGLGPAMFVAAALCIAAAAFTTFIGIRNRPAAVTQPTASAP